MPIINHPIAGSVNVPDSLFQGDDQAKINTNVNNYLADVVAEALKREGVELSSSTVFSESGKRIGSETIRGIAESTTDQVTTTGTQDFMNLVYQRTNPYASFLGGLAGGAADPTNVASGLMPLQKIKQLQKVFGPLLNSKSYLWEAIKKDTAVSALFGALAPEREDYGEGTLSNIGFSALGGSAIGALRGTLGKLAGAKTDTQIQEILDSLSPTETQALNEALDQAGSTLVRTEERYKQRMQDSEGQTGGFVPQTNPVAQAEELARIRGIGDEAEAARKAAQDAELERIRQVGKDEELARIQRVGDEFVPEDLVRKQVDEMRTTMPSSKEASIISKETEQLGNFINKLNARIDNLTKAYNKTSNKKRTPEVLNAMQTLQKQIDDAKKLRAQRQGEQQSAIELNARLQEQKAIQKEIKKYDETNGKYTPSFVKINKPDMTRAEADAAMEAKVAQLQPTVKAPEQPVQQPQATPVLPQQVVPEVAAQRLPEAPMATLGQPTAINTLNPHRSASSAATGGLSDQEIKNLAKLDLRTKEARALEGDTRAEKQLNALKEMGKRESQYYQADSIGGKITWEEVGREAEWIEGEVADAVNEGNYRNAADWVLDTLRKQNNQLGPAQWQVAEKVFAVAERNITVALENIRKLEGNEGNFTARMTAELNGIQNDQALMDVVRQMDALRKGRAGAKASWSAVGRELKRIKRLSDDQYKEYRQSGIVRSIILGVKCK